MRFLIVALLAAQVASAPQTTFRSGVEVVELDVSVTRGGVPVAGLTARDFALTDNGVAQEVASVTLEQLPLSVTMVLDTSQSVAGERLQHLVQAGDRAHRGAASPDDRAALVTFSHAVDLRVPMTGDLTVDPRRARRDERQRRHRRCATPSTSRSSCSRTTRPGR